MKYLLIIGLVITMLTASDAQIEELGATTQGDGSVTGYRYKFTSNVEDTISIKIVDPWGELVSVPFNRQAILNNQSLSFEFNRRFWRKGEYHLIVEGIKGHRFVKKIRLDENGNKILNK